MNTKEKEFSNINIPPVVFGTSGLGNLHVQLQEDVKREIIKESLTHAKGPLIFDTAGKYGAGLALESLGKHLKELGVQQDQVIISNKLGWIRTNLETPEPTFEPGVWKGLKHDAVQKISYDGILECFEQGNELLNGYTPQMVSVHDVHEYLATAKDAHHAALLYEDVLDAYEALYDLKKKGKVQSIGVGAKNWKVIQKIADDVQLDWVMIANSMTIKNHPKELLDFMLELQKKKVAIINAAVFHSGFLIGGDYYDYQLATTATPVHEALFQWRAEFFECCKKFDLKPAAACVQFALKVPGVLSVALGTTEVKQVAENIHMAYKHIPDDFWTLMKEKGLIKEYCNFL